MHCPYCNHKISAHANFCEQCGKKIPKCPTCGHIISKRENFCPVDGTPFPSEFFADWPMEETFLAEETALPEETTLPEPDLQELSYSTAEPIESDVIDDEDFEEEYDEEYDDFENFEDFEDYDDYDESEKTNWKPILMAAAIVGIICIFISYIAIVTGPGTLKTEENIQVEAPAKQQGANAAAIFQHSNCTLLMPQDHTII